MNGTSGLFASTVCSFRYRVRSKYGKQHMPSTKRRYDKVEFARRGDEAYETHVRPHLRPDDEGQFAAVDIETISSDAY